MVLDGMGGYTPGSPAYKPESATIGGVYFALNAASVVSTKSPYIYNITSFGNGATGALIDGSLHASGNRSMLFHTYTAIHSDGLGIWAKNNSNAELISTFTYYCQVGLSVTGGSKMRSLNSSSAYGEYGVYSAGFDAGETANSGTIKGQMLVYTNVLTTSFQDGEVVTGGTSGATARVVNVQAEPKRIYIVQRSGTFQSSETVTGGTSGATATLTSGTATVNQNGRILVTTFATAPDAGDSLQFASGDGNAFQIQSVSSVTANSVTYRILVFSKARATAVAADVAVHARKEFSLARLTGHDFLQVGTGGTDTTNWPNNPTQNPDKADQIITNETDPGRVYYTSTDDEGNFYVGDQFKVDQATGNVTLDASAFNLSGLESLRLGSVGGLIGAAVNEFSTDTGLTQSSNTKVPTQNAVKVYVDTVDGTTPDGGVFTVTGISTSTITQFAKQLNVSGVSTFHGNVNFLDGDRIRIGTSQDFQLYHDGNHSYIAENGTGDLRLQASAGSIFLQKDNGEEMIKATVDGPVELYFNDGKKIETTATGAVISGICTATTFSGSGASLTSIPAGQLTGALPAISGANLTGIAADKIFEGNTEAEVVDTGSDGHFKVTTEGGERFRIDPNGSIGVNITNPGTYDPNAESLVIGEISGGDGNSGMTIVSSATDKQGSIYFADGTGSSSYRGRIEYKHSADTLNFGAAGTGDRLVIDSAGQVLPGADNAQNLGSSSLRWKNIYSADIHCSNKGSKNDVDGTWGDYTIQEGETELYLLNNRNGKKYKFNLTEVN